MVGGRRVEGKKGRNNKDKYENFYQDHDNRHPEDKKCPKEMSTVTEIYTNCRER